MIRLRRATGCAALVLCSLFSCSPGQKGQEQRPRLCTIDIVAPPCLAGQTVKFFRFDDRGLYELVDSQRIDHVGRAQTIVEADSAGCVMLMTIKEKALFIIAEDGTATCDIESNNVHGTPLNDLLTSFTTSIDNMRAAASCGYDSIAHISSLCPEEKRVMLAEFVAKQSKKMSDYSVAMAQNNANALGQYAFWVGVGQNKTLTADDVLSCSSKVPKMVTDFPPVTSRIERCKMMERTSVGSRAQDLQFVKSNGDTCRLFSFLEANRLTLIHIFDPYNQRTPNTLALIDEIRRFSDKNGQRIKLLSVCEFSREDIVKKITDRFSIQWVMVADSSGSAVRNYGLQELPYFIVCDSEGTIVERGIKENALKQWVAAEINQSKTERKK